MISYCVIILYDLYQLFITYSQSTFKLINRVQPTLNEQECRNKLPHLCIPSTIGVAVPFHTHVRLIHLQNLSFPNDKLKSVPVSFQCNWIIFKHISRQKNDSSLPFWLFIARNLAFHTFGYLAKESLTVLIE